MVRSSGARLAIRYSHLTPHTSEVIVVSSIHPDNALVLFSGGQDSTVCLAWALERFARVETVGFDYAQRHRVELDVRERVRERIGAVRPLWGESLAGDHTVHIAALADLSESALTR